MNIGLILVISHGLVLPSLLAGSAAAEIIVNSGASTTFYCWSSKFCKSEGMSGCSYKTCSRPIPVNKERYGNRWKATMTNLTTRDSGCYWCSYQEYELTVLEEKDPSVVIGKIGGSVLLPCASGYEADTKYWCREVQNGECRKLEMNTWFFRLQDPQGTFSLQIPHLWLEDSGKYRCVFNRGLTTGPTIDLHVLSTEKGLSAPETVKAVPGQRVQIVCKYIQDYLNATKSWKCVSRLRHFCWFSEVDDRTRSELVLTISNVDIRDNGNVYTCKVALSDRDFISIDTKLTVGQTDVDLYIKEISTTRSRQTTSSTTSTAPQTAGASLSADVSSLLLFGIIGFLTIIATILIIILLKVYCKRRSDRVQSPRLDGGTFHLNDLGILQLPSPERCVPQQPYTGCMDDSSSTSSESSGHSFGNISSGFQHQYLSIIPSDKGPDYENVLEDEGSAVPDYENVAEEKDQDYVNVPEPQDLSSTEENDGEADRPTKKWEESASSSESSSDESIEEAVNYSKVVFKPNK